MLDDILFSRREFLRTSSILALTATAPSFLLRGAAASDARSATALTGARPSRDEPILVVVQLAGGNDGLNTVVPYNDHNYHRARPRLALKNADLIHLTDSLSINKQLKPLMPWAEGGDLAIIEGVGYPNPDRSHFRSTEIWETAVDSDKTSTTGWIGRYLDNTCAGSPNADQKSGAATTDTTKAVRIGNERPQSFSGENGLGVAMSQPEAFGYLEGVGNDTERAFLELNEIESAKAKAPASSGNDTLDFLRQTTMNATVSSAQIRGAARRYKGGVSYPNSNLARSLKTVSMMIAGGLATRIYYVSHTGFDTHANQLGSHTRLIQQLADGLAAFQKDLEYQGEAERVVTMTFSEFGRRVTENASGGTDHGTAAPMFLLGKNVEGGLHGARPSLTDLDKGDLKYTTDFRQVYSNVLGWLGSPVAPVLGRPFEPLQGLIKV